MKQKVLIKGFFEKNLGDDLFVKVLVDRYPNVDFEMYSSLNYSNVYDNKNLKIYSDKSPIIILRKLINVFLKLVRSKKRIKLEDIRKYDEIIIIGGSIFMEYNSFNYDNYINNTFRYKKPIYILGANFGPYNTDKYIDMHRNIIFKNVNDICFRDKRSYELFKDLENVRYAPDIVFGLDTSNIDIVHEKQVVISVIKTYKDAKMICDQDIYNKKILELISYFREKNYKITLMSFSEKQGDEEVINKIYDSLENKDNIDKFFYRGNINEALNVIGKSQIVIGTRFHANILGFIMGNTVIPIAYSDKTINVLNDMGFKGKIFDIRYMDKFNVKDLTEKDINYKIDITNEIINSQKHFEKLDKIFKE